MNVISFIFKTIMQFQNRNKSVNDLIQEMETSGKALAGAIANKPDTPKNREQLAHMIGLERWGQRRLKTLLGEPLIQDEYDGYRPAATLDFGALRTAFDQTRGETVALARTLQQRGVAEIGLARHNGMGDVSVAIWLRYLTMHANMEGKRIQ